MIQFFIFLRTLKIYFEILFYWFLLKNKTMNKTTLSPIMLAPWTGVFGIKPHNKWNGKHDSNLLENKITTFDHDIYGSYTTESDLEKHCFQPNRKRKMQLISKCGFNWLPKTAIILSNIMITQRTYHRIVERSLKNLQTDYLDVFYCTDPVL
jgi:predicted oxidoreductase